ncbi:MAG: DUF996 domain-containing protein [Campylobacterales bacterium]|nr:DUF996 domain-containing protein [Campylobacterales bacterium]
MNGEILQESINDAKGVILGEDGKRYSFSSEDKKLKPGIKVNYEIAEDGEATGILPIMSQNSVLTGVSLGGFSDKTDVRASGIMGAIGSGLNFLAIIPIVGALFALVGYVLQLIAIKRLGDMANRADIFWNMIISLGATLFGGIIATMVFGFSIFTGSMLNNLEIMGFGAVLGILIALGLFVLGAVKQFKALMALSSCYKIDYFKYAAYVYVIGLLTMVIGIGLLLMIAYSVLMLIGFLAIKELPVKN